MIRAAELRVPRRDLPERTFAFATSIVLLCRKLDREPGTSRTLAHQLLRAGTSIGANIEEGQGSQSRADFLAKYYIACKEAREAHYWLRLVVASGIGTPADLGPLIDEANQLVAVLTAIVRSTRANDAKYSRESTSRRRSVEKDLNRRRERSA